jgi:hypothetical protein
VEVLLRFGRVLGRLVFDILVDEALWRSLCGDEGPRGQYEREKADDIRAKRR